MVFGQGTIQASIMRKGGINADGTYTKDTIEWGAVFECDTEPATTSANTVSYPDGVEKHYSYIATVHDDEFPTLAINDKVRLSVEHDAETREYSVLAFHRYAFSCKVWV